MNNLMIKLDNFLLKFKWLYELIHPLFDKDSKEFVGFVIRIFSKKGRPIYSFGPSYWIRLFIKPKPFFQIFNMKKEWANYIKKDLSESLRKPLSEKEIKDLRSFYDDFVCEMK